MSQLGMNVEVVEQIGHQLKTQAANLGSMINQINSLVGTMEQNWWGHDAQTFCNDWWPQHRNELTQVQHNIDGLGQSALNNAGEQRNVSNH
jgi:uncharacterized protein YukE